LKAVSELANLSLHVTSVAEYIILKAARLWTGFRAISGNVGRRYFCRKALLLDFDDFNPVHFDLAETFLLAL